MEHTTKGTIPGNQKHNECDPALLVVKKKKKKKKRGRKRIESGPVNNAHWFVPKTWNLRVVAVS